MQPDQQLVGARQREVRHDLEVLEVTGHDWMSDPYSAETWLIQRPKQLTRYLADQQATEGVLHFAGGDIANLWAGFIDGAVETALRSARQIIQELGDPGPRN